MVPLYDTDISEERFAKEQWKNYELWEKIERRLKWKRSLWVGLVLLVSLALSAIPVFVDRLPKLKTLMIARKMAFEINALKQISIKTHQSHRLRFIGNESLQFKVEKVKSCADQAGVLVYEGMLTSDQGQYRLITQNESHDLEIPGLIESVCYDVLLGFQVDQEVARANGNLRVFGLGFGYVKDLTEKKLDRISILTLSASDAEILFN